MAKDYKDILYDVSNGVVRITINRPEVYNAFRNQTLEELIDALRRADEEKSANVMVLSGAGDKAFCTGGDQSAHEGQYDGRGTIGLPIEELHAAIRDVPKPVIARVQGYAIGGGNVLCTICDLTIASERAVFGQVGPKVGSVDPGYGTALLARVVGEKKAREMWYLCRRYKAPEALAIAKRSFNMDTAHQAGIAGMGLYALKLYYDTDESREGVAALREKRKPEFRKYAK